MTSLTFLTKTYLWVIYLAGTVVFLSSIGELDSGNAMTLVFLCLLASIALILKVEGSSKRSQYTFAFIVYGFTFATFGPSEAILVILVSYLVEWIWYTPPGYLHFFNAAAYLVAMEVTSLVLLRIVQEGASAPGQDVAGIILGMAIFTAFSHLLNGLLNWLTLHQSFQKSGVFSLFPVILDISLLYFGASLSIVWKANPFALLLLVVPTYLLYSALRVPALEHKSELDSKTGLFNPAYFKKQLDNELARSNRFDRPLAVIIADLDLLRNINNSYGHLAGDAVLIGVANAMKQSVREYDVVSRFGGEEFAILLPETTLGQAYEKAEFFRRTIEAMEFTIPTSMTPIRATMSFGVAHRENSRQTSNDIVHNADLALYNSKLRGRNRTVAHAHNVYLDFTSENSLPGDSIEDNSSSPSAHTLETYRKPPSESP